MCEDKISREAAKLAASDPDADPIIKEMAWDPITRIAGGFAFQCKADLTNRRFVDAHGTATLFRGYEVILRGRDPRDAVFISSRACGVCGGVHSTCSAMAQEMAYGCHPPPLGIVARNLGEAAEMMYDHPLINFNLIGPDYSEVMVKATTPKLWEQATKTPAPNKALHGYATIADVMTALNPLSGKAYVEGLQISRVAREMASLMLGKYPHPSTILPGGVSTTLSVTTFNEYYVRLIKFLDYAKKMITFWDDLVNFFYEAAPEYEQVGSRPATMICLGIYDDPDACDYSYDHANEWGERRMVTPGVIVNGELKTTKLVDINLQLREYVKHSFYEEWDGSKLFVEKDPLGNPIDRSHPWNKVTIPKPGPIKYEEKYTWDSTPRYGPDHLTMETGPMTRHWVTALAGKVNTPHIKATGSSVKMTLPKATLPEMEFEWKIPRTANALERGPKARAYHTAYAALVGLTFLLKAFELLRAGKTKTWSPFKIPDRCIGVGFHEAGRGYLTHHLVVEGGKIANYQILTPSTWMASPRDPWGKPGPYEESVLNTPIVEEITTPEAFKGIDVLRTIRSYDPCMPCTVHLYAGNGYVKHEINTCCA